MAKRCVKCYEIMGKIKLVNNIQDVFLGMRTNSTMLSYCDNDECERYGILTLVYVDKRPPKKPIRDPKEKVE